MRRWRFGMVAVAILAPALVFAQLPGNDSTSAPKFENGSIENGSYWNECLGFSLPMPAGWEVDSAVTPEGKGKRLSAKSLVLLFLRQNSLSPDAPGQDPLSPDKGKPALGRIILNAREAGDLTGDAQEFVSTAVHGQVNSPNEHRELVRETFSADYGGRHFFRADYKAPVTGGVPLYVAYVYTKFRGYFIGGTFASGSPEKLDDAVNVLQRIFFQDDQVNFKCVTSGDNASPDGSVPGGIISSIPPATPKIAAPQRVRVSQGVSRGLLVRKVQPQYPEDARQARLQGQVVMQAEIDTAGNVASLELISGHPMLAPAAMEAVKQWKYKPYLLMGQPVAVETTIIVNFSLSGG